jgi:hypothetical protein
VWFVNISAILNAAAQNPVLATLVVMMFLGTTATALKAKVDPSSKLFHALDLVASLCSSLMDAANAVLKLLGKGSPAATVDAQRAITPPDRPAALKVVLAALMASWALHATPCRASGFEWAVGPTTPVLGVEPGAIHPFQIAPGGGVQFSLTHEAFQKLLWGHTWDLLSVSALAFGQLVAAGPAQFGAFSAGAMVTTMSSLIGVGAAWRLVTSDGQAASGKPIILMALSFNFGLSQPSQGLGVGMPELRGNTVYF